MAISADERSQDGSPDRDDSSNFLAADDDEVDLATGLCEALDDIKVSATFACSKAIKMTAVEPLDIEVNGVGPVKLPLSEEQAKQLIVQSRQAPFGRGCDTIVDTSIRNTWELDPSLFTIRNIRKWDAVIRVLVRNVKKELGVQGPITASLYKMLIYEKGAMFKAHTDTEKIPGMFGSMVVCLPSPHEGGDVVVQHRGQKKIFKSSITEWSVGCWYSDVLHEVLPVVSGYRWVLTYNLSRDPTEPRPAAALLGHGPDKLRRVLRRWLSLERAETQDYFCYGLEHEYTEANLSLNRLKSTDLARGQCLEEISLELDVDIFLGILAKEESGPCGGDWHYDGKPIHRWDEFSEDESEASFHALEDVFETDFYIKKLVDLQGRHVLARLPFEEDSILQSNFFDGPVPKEIEYQGYMGNYGPDATHLYGAAAVVIVRRDATLDFLLESTKGVPNSDCNGDNLLSLIGYYADLSLKSPPQPSAWTILRNLCDRTWSDAKAGFDRTVETSFGGIAAARVLKAAITLREWPFLELAVGKLQGKLPMELFTWVGLHVALTDLPIAEVQRGLLGAVLSYPSLSERLAAIANFAPAGTEVPVPEESQQWARAAAAESLATSATSLTLGEEDGKSALEMVKNYFGLGFLSERVVPLAKARIQDASFTLALMSALHEHGTKGILPREETARLYLDIAQSFVDALDPTSIRSKESMDSTAKSSRHSYSTAPRPLESDLKTAVRHEALVRFVTSILELGADGENMMEAIQSRLISSAKNIPEREFHPFWLPFLRSLVEILDAKQIPLSTPRYQQIFTAMLSSYVDRYVGKSPKGARNLSRRGVSCSCGDCRILSTFLADPQRTVCRFPVNKSRRFHLHSQLAGHDCSHETERFGSPQPLVVTKTFVHNQRAQAAWKAKKAEALGKLAEFDQGKLSELLGPEYSVITGMKHLNATARPAVATSVASSEASVASAQIARRGDLRASAMPGLGSGLPSRSVAGVKRKASGIEVIDLTGDD